MVNISNNGAEIYVFVCNFKTYLLYKGTFMIGLEMVLSKQMVYISNNGLEMYVPYGHTRIDLKQEK